MKHYGNIVNIKLTKEDIVDVVIGGSPCQGLSVAGKRAGLSDERSGLFMEQIRITKEMRELDKRINGRTGESVRPRYGIWENVPGALSSGTPKGEDFRIVLEEFCRIADPKVRIPAYSAGGGGLTAESSWQMNGASLGGFSITSIGEKPSETEIQGICSKLGHRSVAEESRLSQILEAQVPERYCLSPKACAGILARAQNRGKELPTMLMEALKETLALGA